MSCTTETSCVEKIPTGCVIYTGTPSTGSFLDNKNYCLPNLNVIIKDIDDEITVLAENVGLDKDAFDIVNTSCGVTPVVTGLTTHVDKYYSSEVVMKLVTVICDLRSRLNILTSDSTDTNVGNKYLLDIELDAEFKSYLNSTCLAGDNLCDGMEVTTLRDLFQTIITKLCTCCA
jgi:hypothetical protein